MSVSHNSVESINYYFCLLMDPLCILLLLSFSFPVFGSTPASITATHFLKDSETLVSSNSFFELGFFSPANSTTPNRYVGIWYRKQNSDDVSEVIWVANRNNPLNDSSGVLKIAEDGNLQLLNGLNKTFWRSSNVSHGTNNSSSVAQLQDNGSLVLYSDASRSVIWQSFDHPTDSLLPQMELKLSINENMNKKRQLKSWKSPWDPSFGRFRLGINPRNLPEVFIWEGDDDDRPYWRSGPWNGNIFLGVPSMSSVSLERFNLVNAIQGKVDLIFSSANQSIMQHYVLDYEGVVNMKVWNYDTRRREIVWKSRFSDCDVYGKCGPFGSCNSKKSPICGCLKGFQPKDKEEWSKGNWSSGCVRRTPLQCGIAGGVTDGFVKLRNVKVPDHERLYLKSQEDCRSKCLGNCSCLAYAYDSNIGCMIWNGSLIDIQEFSFAGVDLFIRLPCSELGISGKWKIILVLLIIMGTALLAIIYCLWRWKGRHYGNRGTSEDRLFLCDIYKPSASVIEFKYPPFFKFGKLVVATNNFHESNKLGQGGFGPVYKGKLEDGQEIAVKRLSRSATGQGLQEFMNEVLLISKLQHRNLVRLLGCCIEGDEKMLVYEYMPNKSLDALLFDLTYKEALNWKTRFNIIEGICRGVLYLHRDSRLRVIHRDLKASNILLDEGLNPKISDFGMATATTIFGHTENQVNTKVAGTYGYMSPEYEKEGRFSEKSDVFSFGVLVLEIASGKRSSSFENEEYLSLLEYAWKLWNEDNIRSLIDPMISDPCFQMEILRSMQIGLLCVQELPEDRPTISHVILMLQCKIMDLPKPMQPGFVQRKISPSDQALANIL